ncbi:MAG TPA: hypothetical protein DCW90_23170 [Lachnospiraceae bacterium]|nr:AMP-binding protein [uncultured Lachnoclostridium sp.]HAU88268.1 hypothetical protein [Lachnospiraceae bacterium]
MDNGLWRPVCCESVSLLVKYLYRKSLFCKNIEIYLERNDVVYKENEKLFNIAEYLLEDCNLRKGRQDKVAVYYRSEVYTYIELNEKANQYANYLVSKGIPKGNRIGIYLYSSPHFVALFLGAIKAGIIPVLINTKMNCKEVLHIMESTRCVFLFADKRLKSNLSNFNGRQAQKIIMDYEEQTGKMQKEFNAHMTKKEDEAFIIFTSGSSGKPKGVVHRQVAIKHCIESYGVNILQSEETDIFYSPSQLSYAMGLGINLYFPFAVGASAVLQENDDLYSVLDNLRKYPVTKFFAVPSVYKYLDWLIPEGENPFRNSKICLAAGEALPRYLYDVWENRFKKSIYQSYGMTETLFAIVADCDHKKALGLPVLGYQVDIVDELGRKVDTGQEGEITVTGDSVMMAYWENESQTKKVLRDSTFFTGDRGYLDEEGLLWYIGRNKDMFKRNGEWQSVNPIEENILSNTSIMETAVVLEIDKQGNNKLVAYVAIQYDRSYKEVFSGIKEQFLIQGMHNYIPDRWVVLAEIPKGTTGKTDRNQLKQEIPVYVVDNDELEI